MYQMVITMGQGWGQATRRRPMMGRTTFFNIQDERDHESNRLGYELSYDRRV